METGAPAGRGEKRILLAALLFSLLHFASYDIVRQPISKDEGFYLYFAARTAAGDVPYRDFFEHKTPFSIFAGAALQRAGETAGVEPLLVIRGGYLLLAAILLSTVFALVRRLFPEDRPAAWVALALMSGFSLIGLLPAIGNVPKLAAMVFAFLAFLAAHRGRTVIAGVCLSLAAMDWQVIGAVALVALLVSFAVEPPGRRRYRLAGLGAGLCAGIAPFVIYFLLHHGLADFFRMTVISSLSKAADPLVATSPAERWSHRIVRTVRADCAGEEWILALSFAGIVLAPLIARPLFRRRTRGLAVTLLVYQGGILLFSLYDFQGHGDAYPLLVTMALFAAIPAAAAVRFAGAVAVKRAGPRGKNLVTTLAVVAIILAARPSFLRGGMRVDIPRIHRARHLLADQREVATRFFEKVEKGRAAVLYRWEILYLGGARNAVPFTYWNRATCEGSRRADEKGVGVFDLLVRRLDEAAPEAILPKGSDLSREYGAPFRAWLEKHYVERSLASSRRSYKIRYWIRKDSGSAREKGEG